MADDSSDILMMILDSKGNPIAAECMTALTGNDSLTTDFKQGCYFEIMEFDFGIKLRESSGGNSADAEGLNENEFPRASKGMLPIEKNKGDKKKKPKAKYLSWMAGDTTTVAGDPATGDSGYPVELEEIKFERQMDVASPLLFQNCGNKVSFSKAVIVKRKDAGTDTGPEGFLRIDFSQVLITGVEWSNGATVKEKCSFVCRAATVQYRKQQDDGTLGAATPITWQATMTLKGSSSGTK